MNCENFKDLLLTDYVDGVLDPERQKACEAHMTQCAGCRALVSDLRRVTRDTFGRVHEMQPSELVWEGIAEKIQRSPGWLERVRALLTLPRLSIAIPVMASLLIFALIQARHPNGSYDKTRTYLAEELGGDLNVLTQADLENGGFGTVIEDFFM